MKRALLFALLAATLAPAAVAVAQSDDTEHFDVQAVDGSFTSYECVHVSSSLGGQDEVEPKAEGYTLSIVMASNDAHPIEFMLCREEPA